MKIVLYIDIMKNGGAQRVMSILANYLVREKYNVVLVNDGKLESGTAEYELDNEIKRLYLLENFKGNPILKNLKRMVILRKILKDEKPDIVLSFLGNCNIRMLISAVGIKCRKIVSVRNDPNREYGTSCIKKILTRFIFRLADGVVFQTEAAKEYFPKSVQEKSTIIINPVRKEFFCGVRKEKKQIISLGRLSSQKNHRLLIDAYGEICKDIEDDLYIYGEGPLREELERCIKKKGLETRVFLPGRTRDVYEVLARARIFVLSSDYEGMPNALLEALAAGVPCISTDCPCGGPRMVITNEKNGLIVGCNDIVSMKNALLRMEQNDSYRKQLGDAARKEAVMFATDKILKEWEMYLVQGVC